MGAQHGITLARRNLLISLEVNSKDHSYEWLLGWLAKNIKVNQHLSVQTQFSQTLTGRVLAQYNFVPCPGTHYFWHRGYPIKVERAREKQMMDLKAGLPYETVTLTTFGRQREIYFDILEQARQLALAAHEGHTLVYTAVGPEWRQFGHARRKRPMQSVVLEGGVKERIIDDVKDFIANRSWYTERGIPYRRGYLLHGPPGCGKSSFITALSGELDYSISILNLSELGLTDDRLNRLLIDAPRESLVLLEDIDAAFVSRELTDSEKVAYQGLTRLTFSGLLNALDGVASSEGRILFMTTNHLHRLDAALIRPGRVDLKEYIGYAGPQQLAGMFSNFYPHSSVVERNDFVSRVTELNIDVSAAQLQGYFMLNKSAPHLAVNNVHKLKTTPIAG